MRSIKIAFRNAGLWRSNVGLVSAQGPKGPLEKV